MNDAALEEVLKDYDPKDASKKYEEVRTGRPQTTAAVLGPGTALQPLKNLTRRHAEILSLHVSGSTAPEIAEELKCSVATVYRVIADDKSEEMIKFFQAGVKHDLEALKPRVIEVLIEGLTGGTLKGKLETIKQYIDMLQAVDSIDHGPAKTSIEINFKNVTNARENLVNNIRRVADSAVDIEYEEVQS